MTVSEQTARPVTVFGWFATAIVIYHVIVVGKLAAMAGLLYS